MKTLTKTQQTVLAKVPNHYYEVFEKAFLADTPSETQKVVADNLIFIHEKGMDWDSDRILNELNKMFKALVIENITDRMNTIIKDNGYAVQGVASDEPYFYTVGFANESQVEFVVFGAPCDDMTGWVNTIVSRYRQGNTDTNVPYELDTHYISVRGEEAPARYCLQEVNVDEVIEQWTMGMANPSIHTQRPARILQVLWADVNNVLPGEAGYIEDATQAILPTP